MSDETVMVQLNVNGEDHVLEVGRRSTLLDVLRERLDLTGAKYGCGTGDCGACMVLVDDEPVTSCTYLVTRAEHKRVITIEGLTEDGRLNPLQQAFVDAGAVQCGFCTPGMIITATALLRKNPHPTRDEIAASLDHNLCRCTGYVKIVDAIELAAQRIDASREEAAGG